MAVIIGISGKRGAGKDLLATLLGYRGFVNYPFAGALKTKVRQEFNLTKEQTDGKLKESPTKLLKPVEARIGTSEEMLNAAWNFWTPREIMIAYGQFFRQFDGGYWVKKNFTLIEALPDTSLVTISDVRFKNEADYIKSKGGMLIRLNRNPKLNVYGADLNDISETELDDYPNFDFVVPAEHNENPQDLEKVADKLMLQIKKKVDAAKIL